MMFASACFLLRTWYCSSFQFLSVEGNTVKAVFNAIDYCLVGSQQGNSVASPCTSQILWSLHILFQRDTLAGKLH